MLIQKAEYIISAVGPAQYPTDGLPEIALAGRSNVGKSSFINAMLGRRKLVRTSGKPGKTQKLNYFKINDAFYLVDVPGYGYAKVSKQEKARWGRMMEAYFSGRDTLCAVVHLVDMRHSPTVDDVLMHEYLTYHRRQSVTVMTKADKVPKGMRSKQQQLIARTLHLRGDDPLLYFSAVTGEGGDDIWQTLESFLSDCH